MLNNFVRFEFKGIQHLLKVSTSTEYKKYVVSTLALRKGLKALSELLLPWFFLQDLGYQKLDSLILDTPL